MVSNEGIDARSLLASRLDELWQAAGTPLLEAVAARCRSDRASRRITGKNISAWKTGTNVPQRFEPLHAVVSALIEEARRRANADAVSPGLYDSQHWRRWWQSAHESSPVTPEGQSHKPTSRRLGRSLTEILNPYDMEIHPSINVPAAGDVALNELTPYVIRPHDHLLRQVVMSAKSKSAVTVLVGDSSTGKTRACWEAVQILPPTWQIWHPINPSGPEALWEALSKDLITPRTVLWLNDLSYYLNTGEAELGEAIAAGIRDLIRSPKHNPVLVMGTLWRDRWDNLTEFPDRSGPDPHAQARSLLRGYEILVPDCFDVQDIALLRDTCHDDARMMKAADRSDGKVTQFLAGAFELVRRYQMASPSTAAVITAAMDIRRLVRSQFIPEDFLLEAAQGYIDDDAWNELNDDWAFAALKYATRPGLGVPGPLTKVRPRSSGVDSEVVLYRLSDYLEQESRKDRRFTVPPNGFWAAGARFAETTNSLHDLAYECQRRGRFRWAAAFYILMAREGEIDALRYLADHRLLAGDESTAGVLFQEALAYGCNEAWADLAKLEERRGNMGRAEELLKVMGDDAFALGQRARLRVERGDLEEAQRLLESAAVHGGISSKRELAIFLESNRRDVRRAEEIWNEIGRENVVSQLVKAANEVRKYDRLAQESEDDFVSKASSADVEKMKEALGVWSEYAGERADPRDEIVRGRIERNHGLLDAAQESFRRALDGGSMNDNGANRALDYLADLLVEAGDSAGAEKLLMYGLELDGSIAAPWRASVVEPQRLPKLGE